MCAHFNQGKNQEKSRKKVTNASMWKRRKKNYLRNILYLLFLWIVFLSYSCFQTVSPSLIQFSTTEATTMQPWDKRTLRRPLGLLLHLRMQDTSCWHGCISSGKWDRTGPQESSEACQGASGNHGHVSLEVSLNTTNHLPLQCRVLRKCWRSARVTDYDPHIGERQSK